MYSYDSVVGHLTWMTKQPKVDKSPAVTRLKNSTDALLWHKYAF